jgi:hypothetical protein
MKQSRLVGPFNNLARSIKYVWYWNCQEFISLVPAKMNHYNTGLVWYSDVDCRMSIHFVHWGSSAQQLVCQNPDFFNYFLQLGPKSPKTVQKLKRYRFIFTLTLCIVNIQNLAIQTPAHSHLKTGPVFRFYL